MKKLFIVFAALACAGASWAKSVSLSDAQSAAAGFYHSQGRTDVALSVAYQAPGSAYYVFNNGDQGFVIIAGDDRVTPVLGYSDESSFDYSKISPETKYWLGKYESQINYLVSKNVAGSVSDAWTMLATTSGRTAAERTTASTPLLHTLWNQAPLYNAMCPVSSGDTALTGCVATAMAQVMRYWQWPAAGTGTHSYYASGYGTQVASFNAHTYNWTAMPNTISTFNDAISLINYDAGVSVNMHYGATESGSYVTEAESPVTNCAEYALKTYFNYVPTLHGELRSNYDDNGWVALVKSELDALQPLIYSGYGPAGGHCFVADGYKILSGNTYVHFNWGWGGYSNGYFMLSNLNPATNEFNSDQTVIAGVRPNNGSTTAVTEAVAATGQVSVYPNPASSELNIVSNEANITAITITDMTGREVYSTPVAAGTAAVKVATGSIPAGIYLLQLHSGAEKTTQKVVIEH